MAFDFDKDIIRLGTNSLKWDIKENELPMWVADMDFETAPAVIDAIKRRAEHGVFGYTVLPEAWYDAYISWWETRHGFSIKREWLMFCTGVVPAISSAVRKLTTPAEKVVLLTPCYNIFFNSILNNGRVPLECPLDYISGEYSINFDRLEAALSDPQAALMILCNPQNPTGRIYDKQTLAKIGELCRAHGVTVLSDEIHCDITDPGKSYVPFASASDVCAEISLTCISPTKAFNLAGLQTSAIFAKNERLRHQINRAINTDEVAEPNAFAVDAAIAAFTGGAEWLDALREYLFQNKRLVREFLAERLPKIRLTESEATYLLWLDCSAVCKDSDRLAAFIREKTGLFLSTGSIYGSGGEGFLRMNIACSKARVEDGLMRLMAVDSV